MTERQGRQSLGGVAGRSAAGGLVPRDIVNIVQSLGPSYNVGPFQGVDPADLITLSGRTTVAGNYSSLRLLMSGIGANTGSGYTVPSGRQLMIGMVMFLTASVSGIMVIGYADDNINDAVGPPTNPVGLSSARLFITDTANKLYQWTVPPLKVPAGKIPYIYAATGTPEALVVGQLRNA